MVIRHLVVHESGGIAVLVDVTLPFKAVEEGISGVRRKTTRQQLRPQVGPAELGTGTAPRGIAICSFRSKVVHCFKLGFEGRTARSMRVRPNWSRRSST